MTRTHAPAGRRPLTLAITAAVLAGCLAGCISLFPKEKPAQLYRFTYASAATPSSPPQSDAPFTVRAVLSSFYRAAGGDRILTTQGETTAYVADARWAEPAGALLENAVHAAFAGRGPGALLAQGELGTADYRLTLTVPVFEARYLEGSAAPPTVVIEIDAALDSTRQSTPRRDRVFRGQARAQANTVRAIVGAYDTALAGVLDQLVGWTEAKGAS
jgi:cholesterol transport system auxiliary component